MSCRRRELIPASPHALRHLFRSGASREAVQLGLGHRASGRSASTTMMTSRRRQTGPASESFANFSGQRTSSNDSARRGSRKAEALSRECRRTRHGSMKYRNDHASDCAPAHSHRFGINADLPTHGPPPTSTAGRLGGGQRTPIFAVRLTAPEQPRQLADNIHGPPLAVGHQSPRRCIPLSLNRGQGPAGSFAQGSGHRGPRFRALRRAAHGLTRSDKSRPEQDPPSGSRSVAERSPAGRTSTRSPAKRMRKCNRDATHE